MVDEHGLGRRVAPDSRDEAFPMSTVLAEPPPDRRFRYWWMHGAWWDQGLTGTCVGHAWAHWVKDGPFTHRGDVIDPVEVYLEAVLHDPWPENDNGDLQFGTSVRAGAKVLQQQGFLSEYRWAWDIDTVIQALLTAGPVVVGTWWYEGMFDLDRHLLRPTGARMGGHAYVLNGVNLDHGFVRIKNSWGREWGWGTSPRRGYAFITLEDMDRLIREQGEACLAVPSRPE